MSEFSIVETAHGKLRGKASATCLTFKGIPFAKPPVGPLRWQKPSAPEPWTGIRDALEYSKVAPQEQSPLLRVGDASEDCLYLNIWTPALTGKRPVMVWIHGGGFLIGASSQREYNGRALAESGDVVLVSCNYRLGALGFAAFGDLLSDSERSHTNLGIRDQIAALTWVRNNIAQFGGDPDNVTIFGESAGGMSVSTLLATPAAGTLFHKAIAQSGASYHYTPPDDAAKVAAKLLAALDIDPAKPDKLWEVPAEAIVKAQRKCIGVPVHCGPWQLPMQGMNFIPVAGDDILPQATHAAIAQGSAKQVPLLTGTTLEEWRLFSTFARMAPPSQKGGAMVPGQIAAEQLPTVFEERVPGHGARLLAGYRQLAGTQTDPAHLEQLLETDRIFFVPATRMALAQAELAPTYVYRFDWQSPMFGAGHAVDIPFVFGCVDSPFGKMLCGGGPEAEALSKTVMAAWLAFARTGNPATPALPDWPPFDAAARHTLVFDRQCKLERLPLAVRLDLWDDVHG